MGDGAPVVEVCVLKLARPFDRIAKVEIALCFIAVCNSVPLGYS